MEQIIGIAFVHDADRSSRAFWLADVNVMAGFDVLGVLEMLAQCRQDDECQQQNQFGAHV